MTVKKAIEEYYDDYTAIEVYVDLSDGHSLDPANLIRVDDKHGKDYLYAEVRTSVTLSEEAYNRFFYPKGERYFTFDDVEKIIILVISNNHAPRFGRIVLDFDLYNKEESEMYYKLREVLNT